MLPMTQALAISAIDPDLDKANSALSQDGLIGKLLGKDKDDDDDEDDDDDDDNSGKGAPKARDQSVSVDEDESIRIELEEGPKRRTL